MAEKILNIETAFQYLTRFGYAPPNRYIVSFDRIPASLRIPGVADDGQARLKIACEMVDIPVKSITLDDYKNGKHIRKNAVGYTVDPIRMTYRCSGDMMEKLFFDKWQELICDPITGSMEYHANFVGDVTITVLDRTNTPIYAVKLLEAFPSQVASNQLAFSTTNDTLKVDVTLAYTRFLIEDIGLAGEISDKQIQDTMAEDWQVTSTGLKKVGDGTVSNLAKSVASNVRAKATQLSQIASTAKQELLTFQGQLNDVIGEAGNWHEKISSIAKPDWAIQDAGQTINTLNGMATDLASVPTNVLEIGEKMILNNQITNSVSELSSLVG